MYKSFSIVTVLVLLTSLGVNGLFCFKCLNIDCSADDIECQKIRSFVTSELKSLYYIGSYLDPCPQLNETYNWRLMQVTDDPCPAATANEATCTLGRMEIKSTHTNTEGKSTTKTNFATVMGCANRQLLLRIAEGHKNGQCDLLSRNKTDVGVVRRLQVEHCRDLSTQCYEKDYCVDWKQSIIKPWSNQSNTKFDYPLAIGIFAVVIVVVLALLIAGLFWEPPSRPSNLPRTIGDESEVVKVLQISEIKDGKSRLTSIEVEQSCNGNGTMNRRPSVPPPPPPRLHRPLIRESTPV